MNPSMFSPWADAIIERLYPKTEEIQAELMAAGLYCPRSTQIQRRAWKHGFARDTRRAFSDAEDAVLYRLYPDIPAIQRELPDRSAQQIEQRAWRIKATKSPGPFEPVEDAVIARLFPDLDAIVRELPMRTREAVRQRAGKLGVARKAGKHRRYRPGELRLFRIFYPNYDLLCALLAPRHRDAIKRQAFEMGLTRGVHRTPHGYSRPWTEEELEAAKVYGAEIPGRTEAAIDRVRYRNRIKVGRSPKGGKLLEVIDAREAEMAKRRAERQAKAAALRPEREAARKARRNARKREVRARFAVAQGRMPAATRVAPAPRPLAPPAPRPQPRVAAFDTPAVSRAPVRTGNGIDPRVLSAAGRSPFGIELVATVQRTVPRDLWPHVRPLVIEDLTMAVLEGRCPPDGLAEMLPGAIQAVMRSQFQGASR